MKIIIFLFFSFNAMAQKDFIEKNTSIKNAIKLRDPFKAPESLNSSGQSKSKKKDGIYTNLASSEALTVDSIKVKGVLMGQKKRVIITGKDPKDPTYMLSEGSKISNGTVELKAILPSGVIFVEKVTNVYGQTEYLETVVPISK